MTPSQQGWRAEAAGLVDLVLFLEEDEQEEEEDDEEDEEEDDDGGPPISSMAAMAAIAVVWVQLDGVGKRTTRATSALPPKGDDDRGPLVARTA